LGEREEIGKGYRKGFLCGVMWGCVVWLLVVGEGGKWKGLEKGGFMCCNVVMCGVVTGWREGGKWKGLQKGVSCVVMLGCVLELRFGGEGGNWKGLQKGGFMCCNVGMCAVVTGWWRGREMERIR